jgi:hypothetical protein
MLHIKYNDYKKRWPIATKYQIVTPPDLVTATPLAWMPTEGELANKRA